MRFLFSKPSLSDVGDVRGAVVEALKRERSAASVQPCRTDPAELVVNLGQGPVTCHLSNLTKAVLASQASRETQMTAIDSFVHSLIETQTTPAPSAKDIIVGVRNIDYVTGMLHAPFTGDLAVVLMQDQPKSVCLLSAARLSEATDLSEDAAWEQAYENLTRALRRRLQVFDTGPGAYWVACQDGSVLGNSVLLAVPFLHNLRKDEGFGALLIGASSREGIMAVGEDAPDALDLVQTAVRKGQRAPYCQSACVFRLGEGDKIPRPVYTCDGAGDFHRYAPN